MPKNRRVQGEAAQHEAEAIAAGHLPGNVLAILDILDDRGPLKAPELQEILESRGIFITERVIAKLPGRFAEHLRIDSRGLLHSAAGIFETVRPEPAAHEPKPPSTPIEHARVLVVDVLCGHADDLRITYAVLDGSPVESTGTHTAESLRTLVTTLESA